MFFMSLYCIICIEAVFRPKFIEFLEFSLLKGLKNLEHSAFFVHYYVLY